jgi:hypothetical protein
MQTECPQDGQAHSVVTKKQTGAGRVKHAGIFLERILKDLSR